MKLVKKLIAGILSVMLMISGCSKTNPSQQKEDPANNIKHVTYSIKSNDDHDEYITLYYSETDGLLIALQNEWQFLLEQEDYVRKHAEELIKAAYPTLALYYFTMWEIVETLNRISILIMIYDLTVSANLQQLYADGVLAPDFKVDDQTKGIDAQEYMDYLEKEGGKQLTPEEEEKAEIEIKDEEELNKLTEDSKDSKEDDKDQEDNLEDLRKNDTITHEVFTLIQGDPEGRTFPYLVVYYFKDSRKVYAIQESIVTGMLMDPQQFASYYVSDYENGYPGFGTNSFTWSDVKVDPMPDYPGNNFTSVIFMFQDLDKPENVRQLYEWEYLSPEDANDDGTTGIDADPLMEDLLSDGWQAGLSSSFVKDGPVHILFDGKIE